MTRETTDNYRIDVSLLGSGWAAILMCDVHNEKLGKYSDVYQTGIGRYATREEALTEARQWSETDEYPLEIGIV